MRAHTSFYFLRKPLLVLLCLIMTFTMLGCSGESKGSTGGILATAVQDGVTEKCGYSSSSGSGDCSLEKDGYKIPLAIDCNGNPLPEEERGKGVFAMEQHMVDALKEPHDTSSEFFSNNGNISGAGPFGKTATAEEEKWYCCMRWEYVKWYFGTSKPYSTNGEKTVTVIKTSGGDSEQLAWTRKQRIAITNPVNGRTCVCAIIEAGPGPANRIGGISPEVFNYLTNFGAEKEGGQPKLQVLGWCMNESQTLGPADGIAGSTSNSCKPITSIAEGIEGALQWMQAGCDDNTVGYSQGDRESVKNYDGKTLLCADCSSYVYWALVKGGGFTNLEEATQGYSFCTMNMPSVLTSCGWEQKEINGNLSQLQRGDILLSPTHTEFYFGDNNSGGAHSSRGHIEAGDQPGDECSVATDGGLSPTRFTHYFRYKG